MSYGQCLSIWYQICTYCVWNGGHIFRTSSFTSQQFIRLELRDFPWISSFGSSNCETHTYMLIWLKTQLLHQISTTHFFSQRKHPPSSKKWGLQEKIQLPIPIRLKFGCPIVGWSTWDGWDESTPGAGIDIWCRLTMKQGHCYLQGIVSSQVENGKSGQTRCNFFSRFGSQLCAVVFWHCDSSDSTFSEIRCSTRENNKLNFGRSCPKHRV